MSKKQKKRNKRYTGADATPNQPVVHHYTAVERSPFGEWWQLRKRTVLTIAKIAGIAIVVIWLLFEFFRMLF